MMIGARALEGYDDSILSRARGHSGRAQGCAVGARHRRKAGCHRTGKRRQGYQLGRADDRKRAEAAGAFTTSRLAHASVHRRESKVPARASSGKGAMCPGPCGSDWQWTIELHENARRAAMATPRPATQNPGCIVRVRLFDSTVAQRGQPARTSVKPRQRSPGSGPGYNVLGSSLVPQPHPS